MPQGSSRNSTRELCQCVCRRMSQTPSPTRTPPHTPRTLLLVVKVRITATVFPSCLWREHRGLEGRAASATASNFECRHSGTSEPFYVHPLLHIRSLSYESPMDGARWRRGRRFVLHETLDDSNCRAATICCLSASRFRRRPCRRPPTNYNALLDLHRADARD